MRDFDDGDWRDADLFYAALMGRRRRRPRPAPAPAVSRSFAAEPYAPPSIDPGRLFDAVVHRGADPSTFIPSETEAVSEPWQPVALPGSDTPPAHLPDGALVVGRALGEGRLGYLKVLGDDVQAHQLYGRDGLIRPDILVLGFPEGVTRLSRQTGESMDLSEDDQERSATTVLDSDPFHLDPAYSTDGETVPPVWKLSDQIRGLVKQPQGDKASRSLLEDAAVRQLRTALLYEQVSSAYKALSVGPQQTALILYVILFPGEGRDNTGLKDLNDNVLGYTLHTRYITARQQHIRDIFKTPFAVVGQDYKTALVLAKEQDTKNAVKENRTTFDKRLKKLDGVLRTELIGLLKEAEKSETYKDKAKALRDVLEKKPEYRFDIYYGVSVARVSSLKDATVTIFLMLTEALKAAGVGRFIAKGASLKSKPVKQFVKGVDPDKKFDTRGKLFDQGQFLKASNRATAMKRFAVQQPSNDNLYLDYNHIYIDTVWTVAFWERQFVSNPDMIRDVRKKKLVEPKLPDRKQTFKAQKELLELWLVTLNILDFVKDFTITDLGDGVTPYHNDAVRVLQNVRDTGRPIDQKQLEHFLTEDVRRRRMSVLHTASEFQFYASAADHPMRIFFSLDIRDLGVEVLQLYEGSNARIGDRSLEGRRLLDETLRSTDDVVRRRRATHQFVIEVFKRHHTKLADKATWGRTGGGGRQPALKAFGSGLNTNPDLPGFDEAVQVMLGGDEVFIAAHPYLAGSIHEIVSDLDSKGLNMRACVAFSGTPGVPKKGQTPREAAQESHHQAMKLADESHGVLKRFERAHRRIERLIEKLDDNPAKRADVPVFTRKLSALGLLRLFVRVHHAKTQVLTARAFAQLIQSLRAGECRGIELVDFFGQEVDCDRLLKDAEALEKAVREKVGKDNVRTEPPPMYGKKPKPWKPEKDEEG
jgi:hypothetical protein